jgi:hypothetical protein
MSIDTDRTAVKISSQFVTLIFEFRWSAVKCREVTFLSERRTELHSRYIKVIHTVISHLSKYPSSNIGVRMREFSDCHPHCKENTSIHRYRQ